MSALGDDILGGLGVGASVFNSLLGYKSSEKNRKSQEYANEKNLALAREEFDYTKYLNANKFQIQSDDMRKAGINPIAGVGANISTFGGSAGQVGSSSMPFDMSSIVSSLISARSSEKIAEMNNKTQENIADKNNETQKDIADIQAQLQRDAQINERDIANAQIASTERISKLDRQSQERIESDKLKLQDTLTRFVEQNKLVLQSRDFDNSISDDKMAFERSLLKFKSEFDELLESNREMRNSIVLPGQYFSDGSPMRLTLGQASAIMQSYITTINNNPTQKGLDNFCKLLGSLFGAVAPFVGK